MLMQRNGSEGWLLLIVVITLFVLIQGCNNSNVSQTLPFQTEYQAIFLDNSQVFFGKAEMGTEFVTLKDVFYIQSQVNQETKEVKSILIKRGNEWHKPDVMYINKSQVVLIEPVSAGSQVSKLIKEAQKQ
jgi:hypothetical protein